MSYLVMEKGIPNFSKAVISLWFRVPQGSIDKAEAAWTGEDGVPFDGIVPLVVMGERGTGDIPITWNLEKAVKATDASVWQAYNLYNHVNDIEILYMYPPPSNYGRARRTFIYNPNANMELEQFTIDGAIEEFTEDGPAPPTDPTFIGVEGDRLYINFETNKKPTVTACTWVKNNVIPGTLLGHGNAHYNGPIPGPAGPHDAYPTGKIITEYDFLTVPFIQIGPETVIEDTSRWEPWPVGEAQIVKPDYQYTDISEIDLSTTGCIFSDQIQVTADEWHHVLISVDLNTIKTHGRASRDEDANIPLGQYVDSAARMFVAVDDVNYNGHDAFGSNHPSGYEDLNGVITEEAFDVAASNQTEDENDVSLGTPNYELDEAEIPCKEKPVGFPAAPEFVDNIYRIELAEFQMFLDVTLDTSEVENRRAFVDEEGKPVPPNQTEQRDDNGNIIRHSGSIERLGKRPEVLLHGSSNWKNGKNRGSLGIDNEGNTITAGQFERVGEINRYKPDPSLHGPQSPAGRASVQLTRHGTA